MPQPSSALADPNAASAARARNIANEDELAAWLDKLALEKLGPKGARSGRSALAEKWLLTVGRKAMLREGVAVPHRPRRGQTLPDWAQKARASGAALDELALGIHERQRLLSVLDWLRSDHGPSDKSDWSKISLPQAVEAERVWLDDTHARYRAQRDARRAAARAEGREAELDVQIESEKIEGVQTVEPLSDLADHGLPGWRWARLMNKEALSEEGAKMGHCVGTYSKQVLAGDCQIFSLRDPDGEPRATVEADGLDFVQLKGPKNKPVGDELVPAATALVAWRLADPHLKGETLSLSSDFDRCPIRASAVIGWFERGRELDERDREALRAWKSGRDQHDPLWAEVFIEALSSAHMELISSLMPDMEGARRPPWMGPNFDGFAQAIARGNTEVVRFLLPHFDMANFAALNLAATSCSYPMLDLILPLCDPKAGGCSALRAALATAAPSELLQRLIAASQPLPTHALADPLHPTHLDVAAAHSGSVRVCEALLAAHPDAPVATARMVVSGSKKGRPEIVEALLPRLLASKQTALDAGPGFDGFAAEADDALRRALLGAAAGGDKPILDKLLAFADPLIDGSAALSAAAKACNLAAIKTLLPLSKPGEDGRGAAALETAAAAGDAWAAAEALAPHVPALPPQSRILSLFLAAEKEGAFEMGRAGPEPHELTPSRADKLFKALLKLADPIAHAGPALAEAAALGMEARAHELLLLIDALPGSAQSSEVDAIKRQARMAAVMGGAETLHMALAGHGDYEASTSEALIRAMRMGAWRFAERVAEDMGSLARAEASRLAFPVAAEQRAPLEFFKILLDFADPKAQDSLAFELAVRDGRSDLAEMLLPLSDLSERGAEALRSAAIQGRMDLVEMLLPHVDASGQESAALREALRSGHWDIARRLIPVSNPAAERSEALFLAARSGKADLVEELLPLCDPMGAESAALRAAMKARHWCSAKLLIPRSNPRDCRSEALRLAVLHQNVELTEILAPLSDVDAYDGEALRKACKDGVLEIMQVLIPLSDPDRAERVIKRAGFEEEGEALLLAMIDARGPGTPAASGRRPGPR